MTAKELRDVLARMSDQVLEKTRVVVWEPDRHGSSYPIVGADFVLDEDTEEGLLELRAGEQ